MLKKEREQKAKGSKKKRKKKNENTKEYWFNQTVRFVAVKNHDLLKSKMLVDFLVN